MCLRESRDGLMRKAERDLIGTRRRWSGRRRRRRRARSRLTRWERAEHLRLGLVCGR